jgi:hypothetical protein
MQSFPNEAGWKDTVRTEPDAVTRIIIRFEGYTGRYVWHCHLLEHEDNEMMRPYEVVSSVAASAGELSTDVELCIDGRIVRRRNVVARSTEFADIKNRSI